MLYEEAGGVRREKPNSFEAGPDSAHGGEGFEGARGHACLSHHERGLRSDRATWKRQLKRASARVRWDPERDVHLQPLPYRARCDSAS
ncbi:DUF4291 family protein [Streptomyces sp. RB17]|uniref:DUF4291 family protein n=1 Tax=Streptomyces sp. RB17 TaxID=2585197 RepID=UPI003A4C723D